MPYTSLALGLTLTIPTSGTRNWGNQMLATTWTKISQHGHTGSGDGTKIGTAALEDGAVTTAKLASNLGFTQAATLTPAGTTQDIDFANGNIQVLDLGSASGNVTVTTSNEAAGTYYTIFVIQSATAREITWPASFLWPQGQAIILSTANNAIDKIELYFDGTSFYADWDLAYS